MPKGSAIRPPKHGDIRHRAPERAAMKATRRVLDARDSTPTIRTNLPYSPSMERRDGRRWQFTLAKEFRRDLKQRSHLFEQSIGALMEVCDSPMSARSNTVKPLKNELRGMWRYRMGDFRLIYQPDKDRRVVHFLGLKPRADAYE